MKFKYHVPLIGFLVPTFIISTLMFVYRECPPPDQLIGFLCLRGRRHPYLLFRYPHCDERQRINKTFSAGFPSGAA